MSRTWPEISPDPYHRLTTLERYVLRSKLRSGQRRAVRVALRSRSFRQIWSAIRLINELETLLNEADHYDDII